MGAPTDLVTDLLDGAVAERRAAASDLVERATSNPGVVAPSLDRIVGALNDPDDRVRTATARICFEVGIHEPAVIEPIMDELVQALSDPVAGVRSNVARPVAEVVVRDPDAGWAAASALRERLDDDSESVRHSAAWSVEWLATRHPEVVDPERLTDLLTDDHPPVRKHAARTCALLPKPSERRHERLVDLLSDDSIAVREAACLGLGAGGTRADRDALAQAARTDLNDGVRQAARRALREATYDVTAPVNDLDGEREGGEERLAAVLVAGDRAVGHWLHVDTPGVTVRGGRLRGRVESVDPLKGTIHLRNRPAGYRLALRRTGDGWTGTYDGEERSGSLTIEPAGGRRLDTARTPIRYAVEGDRLSFVVEGTPHSIEVTGRDPETGRLRGENWMQGYVVEFRPDTTGPLRALFERGRTFEVEEVTLRVEETTGE